MTWDTELKRSISTVTQLKRYVDIPPAEEKQLRHIIGLHPMRIPRYYADLINWDDPHDPIRRMAVPDQAELDLSGSYDTSGESLSMRLPGLQHKYAQTALLLTTNRCSMYCRHCFRKRLIGLPSEEVLQRFGDAARYVQEHREIRNVLLSGGDPLILATRMINRFLERLSEIRHLNFVRIGSRVPVTFPERILTDPDLLLVMRRFSRKFQRLYVVTHFNHPREITAESTDAVDRLIGAGVALINQTILLKGVNDDPVVLADLQSRLTRMGVSPYYVFQCRPVKRVKRRFQVPLKRGYDIVENAKRMLDGPSKRFRYVLSHKTGKVEVMGIIGDEIFLKYHQARDPGNIGRFFKRRLVRDAGWLDDLPRIPSGKVNHLDGDRSRKIA